MKVFVIIINYHSESKVESLKKAIASAVAETIVIDNSRINRGFAKGVNIGIREALDKGAGAILLINPDVEVSPEQIKQLLHTDFDIVGPVIKFQRKDRLIYDYGGKIDWWLGRAWHQENEEMSEARSHREQKNKREDIDYISGACMLVKREIFEKIGFFDERFFMYFEDVDFCLRAKQSGFRVALDTQTTVIHDLEEHRSTHNRTKIKYQLASNFKFIQKWVPWYFWPSAFSYWLILTVSVIFRLMFSHA